MSSSIARDGILNEDTDRLPIKSKSHLVHDDDRTRSPSAIGDEDLKHEYGGPDVRMADAKPSYKSWKKKYRKMRIQFDQLQAQNEELYQLEQKALKKTKQLAIYNDRLLEILLDINNRPQIPTEKRFDLSLPIPSDAEEELILPIDKEPPSGPRPAKSLRDLINDVPHLDFAATAARFPEVARDLLTGIDSPALDTSQHDHPPSLLTADDIDNYMWEIDVNTTADPDIYGELEMLPTLAPLAREQNNGNNVSGRGANPSSAAPLAKDASAAGTSRISMSSRDFALRNPTSVYNWLRKHAPKTFLQDHDGADDKKDKAAEKASRKAHRADDDAEEEDGRPTVRKGAGGSARKASGEGRASTGASRATAKGERTSKRSIAASAKDKRRSMDETKHDFDNEIGSGSKSAAPGKGKRKRAVDDDTGYRPKGGSSRRPAKKRTKNNSLGGGAGEDRLLAPVQAEFASAKKNESVKEALDEAMAGTEAED